MGRGGGLFRFHGETAMDSDMMAVPRKFPFNFTYTAGVFWGGGGVVFWFH